MDQEHIASATLAVPNSLHSIDHIGISSSCPSGSMKGQSALADQSGPTMVAEAFISPAGLMTSPYGGQEGLSRHQNGYPRESHLAGRQESIQLSDQEPAAREKRIQAFVGEEILMSVNEGKSIDDALAALTRAYFLAAWYWMPHVAPVSK